jgi:hypothetical protein
MMKYRITGIRKPGGAHNPHEAVSHYRWVPEGSTASYIVDRQTAVDTVRGDQSWAYVQTGINSSWCYVRKLGSTEFLQTYSDNTWTDNLLSLDAV